MIPGICMHSPKGLPLTRLISLLSCLLPSKQGQKSIVIHSHRPIAIHLILLPNVYHPQVPHSGTTCIILGGSFWGGGIADCLCLAHLMNDSQVGQCLAWCSNSGLSIMRYSGPGMILLIPKEPKSIPHGAL